ncbi:MAG: preQ(1) synthase [Candidatus Dormibacteraeota bacterium]|nr:preQ(1) synthase [Candidatus Dormibacteraeota bacterium]
MSENAKPRSLLESFDNRSAERDYTIQFTLPEFTCLCPRSGFPDFAVVHVRYVPGPRCVELKSLKMYVNAFRNVGVFHEDVVNGILSDLISLLAPRYCEVVGDFNVRGNIKTVVRATHRDPGFGGEPDGWWTPRDEHSATF